MKADTIDRIRCKAVFERLFRHNPPNLDSPILRSPPLPTLLGVASGCFKGDTRNPDSSCLERGLLLHTAGILHCRFSTVRRSLSDILDAHLGSWPGVIYSGSLASQLFSSKAPTLSSVPVYPMEELVHRSSMLSCIMINSVSVCVCLQGVVWALAHRQGPSTAGCPS
ncbi:uncharacterized protein EI90DRAFT_3090478, partial [Cantharellus anzutake]|uniref:uncharacterized protein n=1 Tax=Cantharellus anzutake TaxID=1750568 RepID=UPI0019078414